MCYDSFYNCAENTADTNTPKYVPLAFDKTQEQSNEKMEEALSTKVLEQTELL
jgi:hypothetical protein